ncbi:MAG: hypothetical protein AAEJ52_08860, partial [Myxococcota bacterium]
RRRVRGVMEEAPCAKGLIGSCRFRVSPSPKPVSMTHHLHLAMAKLGSTALRRNLLVVAGD